MEIFNIHIFEFLLIAGLALVVFGPERLPEVGRFVGKQVARVLAWQQQSPEARMLQDIRQEFEQEIVSLRDELVRTRQQLDITKEVKMLDDEARALISGKQPLNVRAAAAAPNKIVTPAEAAEEAGGPLATEELVGTDGQPLNLGEVVQEAVPNGGALPEESEAWVPFNERPEATNAPQDDAPVDMAGADRQMLLRQLHMLMADMQALTIELQERGVLEESWQPPSHIRDQESVSR